MQLSSLKAEIAYQAMRLGRVRLTPQALDAARIIASSFPDQFKLEGDELLYIGAPQRVTVRCHRCGFEYAPKAGAKVTARGVKVTSRCPRCGAFNSAWVG